MRDSITHLGLRPMGNSFRPPTSTYVGRLETLLSAALPSEYRNFLSQYGVCTFSDYVSFSLPDGPRIDLNVFLGSDPDDSFDLGEVWRGLAERLPEKVLPVALDPNGNAVCLNLAADDYGSVHFWDHESDALTRLSSSFPAFMAILRRDPA